MAVAVAGVNRRTKLIKQQVSGRPAVSTCPAATAERLVAASLEPGAVVASATQLLPSTFDVRDLASYKNYSRSHVGHNPTFFLVCDFFPHK
jgi:hypothetical protein